MSRFMELISNSNVKEVFEGYPHPLRQKMLYLRKLILDTANKMENVNTLEETLKWGEPSYLTKYGSTLRIGCNTSNENDYALYFNCNTKLIDTFKEIYGKKLSYSGNRAIIFNINDKIPTQILQHCIELSLNYHKVKHLPLLGA